MNGNHSVEKIKPSVKIWFDFFCQWGKLNSNKLV